MGPFKYVLIFFPSFRTMKVYDIVNDKVMSTWESWENSIKTIYDDAVVLQIEKEKPSIMRLPLSPCPKDLWAGGMLF